MNGEAESTTRLSPRAGGIALAAMAAVFASSAGVLLRHIDSADAWTILFYRSLGFTVAVLVFVLVVHGRRLPARFRAIGVPGLVVAVCLGGAFLAFVLAMLATNVATVVAVLSAAPMAAALLGWTLLGERPSLLGWAAMLTALTGVCVVVWDGLAAGAARGLVFAVLACLGYAGAIVGLRAGRQRDMMPAVCLSGIVAGLVSLLMLDSLSISRGDLVISILLGTVQIGAQYILLTLAARLAPAADIALVMILEVVLAPLWVWLLVGEAVPVMVLWGGLAVIAALAMNAMATGAGDVRAVPAERP